MACWRASWKLHYLVVFIVPIVLALTFIDFFFMNRIHDSRVSTLVESYSIITSDAFFRNSSDMASSSELGASTRTRHNAAHSQRQSGTKLGSDRTINMNILVFCSSKESHDGGERISCTNYAHALKTYGHRVTFSSLSRRPALEGFHVIIIHGKNIKHDKHLITSFKSESKGVVVCVVKPHNVNLDLLSMANLVVVDSWFQSLAMAQRGETKLDDGQLVRLKLLEVPSHFWDGSSPLRPRPHEVFHGMFSLERPAIICYHGNDDHLNEAKGVLDVTLAHISRQTPLKFIAINRGKWTDGRPVGVQIKEYKWSTMDTTYDTLRGCDLGLVPHLVGKPVGTSCGHIQPGTNVFSLTWKDSANAGRAFVFAQLGVPFVAGPDFETLRMLGDAGLEEDSLAALTQGQWEKNVGRLLADSNYRQHVSERLLQYSEANLDITREGRKLEAALLSRILPN